MNSHSRPGPVARRQPGLEAVITSESSIPCLGETLDYVTGRMKTVIVEVLSALCLLSPEAHLYATTRVPALSLCGVPVWRCDEKRTDLCFRTSAKR
jgi:hypothetical protein